jgi:hypothetical protein
MLTKEQLDEVESWLRVCWQAVENREEGEEMARPTLMLKVLAMARVAEPARACRVWYRRAEGDPADCLAALDAALAAAGMPVEE